MKSLFGLSAAALAFMAVPASAAIVTLDFEGIGDNNPVADYYNGGDGTNYGISFSPQTLALVDADAGGSGNFSNEPSGDTIMFFLDASSAILNVAAGFDTGFSFWYTSSTAASVTVWSDVDGGGTLLGTINLTAQAFDGCPGDPNGPFNCWTNAGVAFIGTAKSINFGGTAGYTGYDNITFGADRDPGGAVPEPTTWAMMIGGFGMIGSAMRHRRRKTAVSFA